MAPKVSVIIPVYNTEEYLGQCLDSVLMQSLEDIEIICIDDGSKDDSLSTLQTYAFLDSRLKVISQEHAGASAAKNKGLAEAKGQFVCFLNSADFFDPEMLEKMVQTVEKDKADVVVCGYNVLNNALNEVVCTERLIGNKPDHTPCSPGEMHDNLFQAFPEVMWNKLIRMDLIRKYNLKFDESVRYEGDFVFNAMILMGADKITWMDNDFICNRENYRIPQEDDLAERFQDRIKGCAVLFNQLKEFSLDKKFEMPYTFLLKAILWEYLNVLPVDKCGEAVRSVVKNVPDIILRNLLQPSPYVPRVSIIVPVYNTAEFLPECLDSLIHQTLQDIEIICVNDGSTDNSLDILNEYAQKDNRIQVISQENMGQAMARNAAMEKATGTYVQFVDSDDVLVPDACEILYFYARFFQLDMLSFAAKEFLHSTQEEFNEPYHQLAWTPEVLPSVFNWRYLQTEMAQLAVTACLTIYRRLFLNKNDIHWLNQKKFFEDTPFFVESVFCARNMGVLKIPLYRRRIHNQATSQHMAQHFHDLLFVYKHVLKLLQKKKVPNDIIHAYAELFCDKVYANYMRFTLEERAKEMSVMYDFGIYMLRKYQVFGTQQMQLWMQTNCQTKKTRDQIKFRLYCLQAKLIRKQYRICLLELNRFPNFSIKMFGIPLLELEKKTGENRSLKCKVLGCPLFSVTRITDI